MAFVVVPLRIRVGVRLARRIRPGLDPKATEAIVLRFLGDTTGPVFLLLVPVRAIVAGELPSEGAIGQVAVIRILVLALFVG